MSWTYDGDPAASIKDSIRFLIGDTNTSDQLLSDEEIAFVVTENGSANRYGAAAAAARAVVAKFARKADFSNMSLSVSASQRAAQYRELAQDLDAKALTHGGGVEMFVGGATKANKDSHDENTTYVQPAFKIGMDDVPGRPGGRTDLND